MRSIGNGKKKTIPKHLGIQACWQADKQRDRTRHWEVRHAGRLVNKEIEQDIGKSGMLAG